MTINYTRIEGVDYEPQQAHTNDLGFDVCATELERIDRGQIRAIRTGLMLEPPENVGFFLCIRSGLAKRGLMLMNGVGVIDPTYRGEVIMLVTNISRTPIVIQPGERVGQLVPYQQVPCTFQFVETINNTERGEGGFGSTGT